ncbi:YeeE/YedE family protein [Thalassotalea sp. HSM 43]|uniref:YeeE/YedE family protein n=1 Tax=Thalassotalea sp. HSM 43 TaxID=2552945 RepID=UPI0010814C62|nr:YeeE/YedE family protein [Thalassotalea sp. HSM 43]QBY05735.1 YeeE/YedE family protein [Thalassotalea sp. HSM 43]
MTSKTGKSIVTNVSAFVCGLIFAIGLTVSQMVNPDKVLNFLDLFGNFDASLGFVMAGALMVFISAYLLVIKRMEKPIFASNFDLPKSTSIDSRLIIGSAIFGIGWGLSGICPGPAVANIIGANDKILAFILMMLVGMIIAQKANKNSQ